MDTIQICCAWCSPRFSGSFLPVSYCIQLRHRTLSSSTPIFRQRVVHTGHLSTSRPVLIAPTISILLYCSLLTCYQSIFTSQLHRLGGFRVLGKRHDVRTSFHFRSRVRTLTCKPQCRRPHTGCAFTHTSHTACTLHIYFYRFLNVHTYCSLTLILLTWTIWRALTNASKWRMAFNSAFKGLTGVVSELGCWLIGLLF